MNHKRTISSKFYTCKEVKKLVLSGYYICLLVMIKGFYKNTAKSAALLAVCIFCMLFTASCGKKDKSIFISSNDQYNKKFKKNKNESMPMLNAIYTPSEQMDKISYYELQAEYFNRYSCRK
jgi:hypothetical protein